MFLILFLHHTITNGFAFGFGFGLVSLNTSWKQVIKPKMAVAAAACSHYGTGTASSSFKLQQMRGFSRGNVKVPRRVGVIKCSNTNSGIGLGDFIGGDLIKPDLGRWLSDVEKHKAIAIYTPHEGGYEGRYLNRLRYQGYYFLDLTARGLGDPETTLTKVHPVCPVSCLYKQHKKHTASYHLLILSNE